jgi:uncharacterized delta-60 repeat protein
MRPLPRPHRPRTLAALLMLAAAGVPSSPAAAQTDGDLATGFGTGGVAVTDIRIQQAARSNVATGVAVDPAGRLVLAGGAQAVGSTAVEERMVAVRLTPGGELDPSFGSGGKVRVQPFPEDPAGTRIRGGRLALAPDGEIYLYNGATSGPTVGWALARLTPAGTLDHSFADQGIASFLDVADTGVDVAARPDGKVLELEGFLDEGAVPINFELAVCRLLADGSYDTGFGDAGCRVIGFDVGAEWDDYPYAMVLQPDGRILVAGSADVDGPGAVNSNFAVARLTANGNLDSSFGNGGKVVFGFDGATPTDDVVRALAIDPRGRILLAGAAGNEAAIARLTPTGALDPTFATGGKRTFHFGGGSSGLVDVAFGIAVQSDGKVIAVGRGAASAATGMRFAVARLTASGALDPSFAGGGTRLYDLAGGTGDHSVARAVTLLADGRPLVVGGAESAPGDFDFVAVELANSLVFADGFESADAAAWSAASL